MTLPPLGTLMRLACLVIPGRLICYRPRVLIFLYMCVCARKRLCVAYLYPSILTTAAAQIEVCLARPFLQIIPRLFSRQRTEEQTERTDKTDEFSPFPSDEENRCICTGLPDWWHRAVLPSVLDFSVPMRNDKNAVLCLSHKHSIYRDAAFAINYIHRRQLENNRYE